MIIDLVRFFLYFSPKIRRCLLSNDFGFYLGVGVTVNSTMMSFVGINWKCSASTLNTDYKDSTSSLLSVSIRARVTPSVLQTENGHKIL